jgi:hypothetical protein
VVRVFFIKGACGVLRVIKRMSYVLAAIYTIILCIRTVLGTAQIDGNGLIWILAICTALAFAFGSSILSDHLRQKIAPLNNAQPFTQEELDNLQESFVDPDE